jgi:hypothetical protein
LQATIFKFYKISNPAAWLPGSVYCMGEVLLLCVNFGYLEIKSKYTSVAEVQLLFNLND